MEGGKLAKEVAENGVPDDWLEKFAETFAAASAEEREELMSRGKVPFTNPAEEQRWAKWFAEAFNAASQEGKASEEGKARFNLFLKNSGCKVFPSEAEYEVYAAERRHHFKLDMDNGSVGVLERAPSYLSSVRTDRSMEGDKQDGAAGDAPREYPWVTGAGATLRSYSASRQASGSAAAAAASTTASEVKGKLSASPEHWGARCDALKEQCRTAFAKIKVLQEENAKAVELCTARSNIVVAQEATIKERNDTIRVLETQCDTRQTTLEAQKARITQLNIWIKAKEGESNVLQELLAGKKQELIAKETVIKRQETTIAKFERENSTMAEMVAAKNEDIDSKNLVIGCQQYNYRELQGCLARHKEEFRNWQVASVVQDLINQAVDQAIAEQLAKQAADLQHYKGFWSQYGTMLQGMSALWEPDDVRKQNAGLQATARFHQDRSEATTERINTLRSENHKLQCEKFEADTEIAKLETERSVAQLDLDIQANANDHLTLQADCLQRKEDVYCALLQKLDKAHLVSKLKSTTVTSTQTARDLALAVGVDVEEANKIQ